MSWRKKSKSGWELFSKSGIVAAFCRWLRDQGWMVQTEVTWADVVAERGDERLVGEAKGVAGPGFARC